MESRKATRIGGKDLIHVGLFTAIIFVIEMVISFIGFIPFLMPLYCVLMPLCIGIPWMLFVTKVQKFGMILIMEILLGIILMLTGMGWYAMPLNIVVGLIAEWVVRSGGYQSIKKDIIGYGFFSCWVFGSFIPLIFKADQYWEKSSYGADYIAAAKSIFQLWTAPALLICCFVFGLLGGWIGVKLMKKHFVKAGIV